jgi:putative lipoprotein
MTIRARTATTGLALTFFVTLVGGGRHARAQAQDDDPWFGRDKALHFSFSAALAGAGYGGAALLTEREDRRWRLLAGAGVALCAGIGKELYDLSGHGDASARDLAWDAIGTATGLLVAWTIDRLLFQPARPGAAAP